MLSQAQKQTLREYLLSLPEQTRSANGEIIEINIKKDWAPKTGVYETDETLVFSNGRSYRIVNGTLKRAETLKAPLIKLQSHSTLELASTAILSGGNYYANNHAIVEIESGEFTVSGGKIIENGRPEGSIYNDYDDGISLTSSEASIIMNSGYISKSIKNLNGGSVTLKSGEIPVMGFVATDTDITMSGQMKVAEIAFVSRNTMPKVKLTSSLADDIKEIAFSYWDDLQNNLFDQCVMVGEGYQITQTDLSKMITRAAGCHLSLEGNAVYVRKNASKVQTVKDVEPGTLPSRIPENNREIIEELTVTGNLNGTDIKLIRELAQTNLKKLDISGANIVSGGDAYLDNNEYTPSVSLQIVERGTKPTLSLKYKYTSNNVIGNYMFAGLTELTELYLPLSIERIVDGAFMDCPKLKTLSIGYNIQNISSGFLFCGSNAITNLTIHSSCHNYRSTNGIIYAYEKNKTLVAVIPQAAAGVFEIANTVDSIAPYVFAGYKQMSGVKIPASLTHISDYAFCQSGLSEVNIVNTVKSIGKGSFLYCEKLSKVTFTDGLESIGAGAFAYCNLIDIDLSNTTIKKLIGDEHSYPIATSNPEISYNLGVFEGNENVATIKLPLYVEIIGGKVFTSSKLKDVYCKGVPANIYYNYSYTRVPGQLGGIGYAVSNSFYEIDYTYCRLHVPLNTCSLYQAATGWKEFSIIMEDQPEIQGVSDYEIIRDVEPGTLSNRIPLTYQCLLERLTITGQLNGTDIKLIREMANNRLARLDISGSDIVRGGDYYNSFSYGLIYTNGKNYYTSNDSITGEMFSDLISLKYLALPKSIRYIECGSYVYSTGMPSPMSEATRDMNPFAGSPLETIVIGPKVQGFKRGDVFLKCENLKNVILTGNSYLYEENGIIYDATSVQATLPTAKQLSIIRLPNSVKTINQGSFTDFTQLNTLILSENLINIESGLFNGSTALTTIKADCPYLTTIGSDAFVGCTSLKTINLSNTAIKTIGFGTFSDCEALISVSLPKTITEIGHTAFFGKALTDIYCAASVPPTIHELGKIIIALPGRSQYPTFDGVDVSVCRVHIPLGTLSVYKADKCWGHFNYFVEEPFGETDPNLIPDEDWLQRRLNEIAEEKPSEPVVLTIPEGGISLSRNISVPNNCKAIITGGPIIVSNNISGEGMFLVYGSIEFRDIIFELGNYKVDSYFWISGGELTIGKNVIYHNIYQGNYTLGAFYVNDGGLLKVYSGDIETNESIVSMHNGNTRLYGGTLTTTGTNPALAGSGTSGYDMHFSTCEMHSDVIVEGKGKCVVDFNGPRFIFYGSLLKGTNSNIIISEQTETSFYGGGIIEGYRTFANGHVSYPGFGDNSFTIFKLTSNQIEVTRSLQINHSEVRSTLPVIYLGANAVVSGSFDYFPGQQFNGDWENMQEGHVILLNIQESSFKKLSFLDLTNRMEIKHDSDQSHAYFHRMSLAEWLEKQNEASEDQGTEDAPVYIDFPEDEENGDDLGDDNDAEDEYVEIGKEDDKGNASRRVHYWWRDRSWQKWRYIDRWPHRPTLRLKRHIYIRRGSSLRWSRFYLSGLYYKKYIYVYGTLIIDGDVYIRHFRHRFIRVMPGGRVIWRGGRSAMAGQLINNEGGTVIYESGEAEYDDTYASEQISNADRSSIYNDGGNVEVSGGTLAGKLYNINGGDLRVNGETQVETVRNEAIVWLGVTRHVPRIEMKRTARIRLLRKLIGKLVIRFYSGNEEDVFNKDEDMPQPGDRIIEPTDDYSPTHEDVDNIDTDEWPEGIKPKLDDDRYIVIFDVSAGIHDITADCKIDNHVYDMLGRRVTRTISGHVYYQGGKKFIAK